MSLNRVMRFIVGTVIASVLIWFIGPKAHVPNSHMLPPAWVYAKAQGQANGLVTNKRYDVTSNPFNVGGHLYFVTYTFQAPDPNLPPKAPKATYTGEIRVDKSTYHNAAVNQAVNVKYEKTYPWVNGLLDNNLGVGCGEGSNVLSGWLIWPLASLAFGYILMMVLEQFGGKEDI